MTPTTTSESSVQRWLRVYPARVVAVLTSIVGVLGALVPVLANFDTSSVAGWIGGLTVVATTVALWLHGNAKNEVADKIAAGLDTAVEVEHDLEPILDRWLDRRFPGGSVQPAERPRATLTG